MTAPPGNVEVEVEVQVGDSRSPSVPAPDHLPQLAARIDARLVEVVSAEATRWTDRDDDLAGPFGEIRRMVEAGGKRLRPAFCFWGFVGSGGDPDDPRIIDAGAAFELMHAFALFHDDVMDDAATRRGAPTTHAVYAATHRAEEWAGESRRFGDGAAILVGDLAFVLSDALLLGASDAVWRMWNELRLELNVGQFLDVLGSARRERRVHKTERIARYKSGRYSIERPLHLGVLLADPAAAPERLDAFSRFGLPLGDAFQMRDDVMGVFGDAEATGKPVGGDLVEGKPTPLLARAVARATPAQSAVLDRVGRPGLDDDGVAAVQQVIVDTGALAELEAELDRLVDQALSALRDLPLDGDAARELEALAAYVIGRTT
ncbi:polyprenyl synthetase family protein [soil metagenome]